MPWLWRIIAALVAFVLATLGAYVERSLGHAVDHVWRLLGAGLILVAALLGLALLISGLMALVDARTVARR
ncbi:MAG TPA: hypothetical protein VN694_10720 [Caulobacteraceae bacterium]|nr:hypothetical protein [Caulobacteraceae bacterium]